MRISTPSASSSSCSVGSPSYHHVTAATSYGSKIPGGYPVSHSFFFVFYSDTPGYGALKARRGRFDARRGKSATRLRANPLALQPSEWRSFRVERRREERDRPSSARIQRVREREGGSGRPVRNSRDLFFLGPRERGNGIGPPPAPRSSADRRSTDKRPFVASSCSPPSTAP